VKGALFTVQKAFRLMTDGGSIILNASIVASKGLPNWSVYSATKAAMRSFARTIATDLKDRRIRVNAVSPGFTDTPPWHASEAGERYMKSVSNGIPIARFGTADEIANAVVFLRFRRQQLRHRNGIVRGRRLRAGVIGAHLSITWPGRAVAAAS
jgi:NAD(P)-dependent dehydrogenase (short-subunit alcohol dehydrogenase family)